MYFRLRLYKPKLSRFVLYVLFVTSAAFALSAVFPNIVQSQSLTIGGLQDEQLRIQLLLKNPEGISTVNRPFSRNSYERVMENASQNRGSSEAGWWNRPLGSPEIELPAGFRGGLHPLHFQSTYNTRFPHGENNQAAWFGNGLNTEGMGGFWLTSDFLTISVQPHIIWQQNQDFLIPQHILRDSQGNPLYLAEGIGNVIDAPFRFGPDPLWTFDWGYSSARDHYRKLEAVIRTEPLWWGPMTRYPLIMSNNSPGVNHAFIGAREPLRVPWVGWINFRWIFGYPEESGYFDHRVGGQTRFMNSLNLAWSPAFLKTLTLGATRTYHQYETDGFDWDNVSAMFNPFQKAQEGSHSGERNQLISFYAQLVIPEAHAEIYGEFLREDHSYDWRDFLNEPHQNSGWAFGFQKLFLGQFADFYKVNMELTNLTISQIQQVRSQDYYYSHAHIRQGHTNRGHILGAAIGPGSNSQFLSIDGYRGDYKAGIFVQRVTENDNFHLLSNTIESTPNENFGDYFRHRVNLNLGLNFLYGPGPFYLTGSYVWTKAYNYGRFDYGRFQGINITNYEHKDLYNSQLQIGITYVF